jgi:hypothetical protein
VQDSDLLILLHGIKELAQLRGFTDVTYQTNIFSDFVVAVCTIKWIPNFETENQVVTFSAIGDATPANTSGVGRIYLGPIAENRAFLRCVKSFLRINLLGKEEIGGKDLSDDDKKDSGTSLLLEVMAKHNVTFEQIKNRLVADKFEGAEGFGNVSDIPRFHQFALIEKIREAARKKSVSNSTATAAV